MIMVSLVILLSLTLKIQAQMYQVVDLGDLGGGYSQAAAINNSGAVVGYSYDIDGNSHAFLYLGNGPMQDLGTLGGDWSFAYGINNNGQIVGTSSTSGNSSFHAFLYSDGVMGDIGTLGGSFCDALAINNNAKVVGYSYLSDNYNNHGFLYANNTLDDLNDLIDPSLGLILTKSTAINDVGQIVISLGYKADGTGTGDAFLYNNGSIQDLGTLYGGGSFGDGINVSGQVVGTSDGYAFLYSDGVMKNMNTLIHPASGWTLIEAVAINNVGQIIASAKNSDGQTRAVILNPIGLQTIQQGATNAPYGDCITKDPNKDSLIVITHGWINPLETAADTAWVDTMSNAICQYLSANNITNWQVIGYKWINAAETGLNAELARNNAIQQGDNLGQCIELQGWTHYHFIAHSAGSALIEECAKTIKNLHPEATIHCTFLDPFVGIDSAGKATYGDQTTWSDDYFSRDLETGGETWQLTEGLLDHAYSIDVTRLDPNRPSQISTFISVQNVLNPPCPQDVSSHGWPIQFYMNTITGATNQDYAGFGFQLSEEANNWEYALSEYGTPNQGLQVLGQIDPLCYVDSFLSPPVVNAVEQVQFFGGTLIQSATGVINKFLNGLKQTTDSPVWSATYVTVSNTVNNLSFDSWFDDAGGAGVLSVYWDTNVIGFVDESVVQTNMQHYTFSFPSAGSNTVHMLGFRLEPYSATASTVIITNVSLGYAGVNQPFTLSVSTNTFAGMPVFQLSGEMGFNYTVQASTNLIDWDPIAVLINTNGTVPFIDPDSRSFNHRFYRAVAPF